MGYKDERILNEGVEDEEELYELEKGLRLICELVQT